MAACSVAHWRIIIDDGSLTDTTTAKKQALTSQPPAIEITGAPTPT